MKWLIVRLMLIGFAVFMVLSGTGRMTGYYSDPDGYGFHDIWFANMHISLSFLIMGTVAMAFIVRKLERMLF